MAFRSDVTVDWTVSPRIITVASPSTTITIQDLVDTLFQLEAMQENMRYPSIYAAAGETESASKAGTEGKTQIGTGRFTGIVCVLDDALLAFEARGGPTYTNCFVTDGDLVAYDNVGAIQPTPLLGTAFVNVHYQASTSPGLVSIADEVVEGSYTMAQLMRGFASALLAKMTGSPGPGTILARDLADTKDRISATVDANGNRTVSPTLDLD